jgi:predicted nuclease of restriction endonuclease-like (RecB) superfamily
MNLPERHNISNLHVKIRDLILEARSTVRNTVNFVTVIQNWEIGRMIVEEEQGGKAKAEYGKYLIKELSAKLTNEFGNGYSIQNLKFFRQFYQIFPIGYAVRSQLEYTDIEYNTIRYAVRSESIAEIVNAIHTKSHPLFNIISPQLSWTHYRLLLKVDNPKAREFYMKEAVENNWSTRALERQINSFYYERIMASQDKKPLIEEMKEKTKELQPEDILKDPYILEFLQLKENKKYLESDLEQALIDKMNDFLLELGKGFAFVARQKRISTETKHFYIDLVFYNYILKCFVLIDLKTGELTHQNIGQMDMYVRLYEDKYKAPDDNPTIGIILCTENDKTIVKYSVLNESKQLFASKYKLYLPTEEELRREIEQQKHYFEIEKINNNKKTQ